MIRPSACWLYTSSAYTDNTSSIRTNTDFNFIGLAADEMYIGLERRFIGIYCDLTTNGSYTGLSYYYWNGLTWKTLAKIDTYDFDKDKYQRWVMPNDWTREKFSSTWPYSATPPDDVERYWIKITVSAVTTTAVIDKIRLIPFVEYATPTEVFEFLQLKQDFSGDTVPTDTTVEGYIRRAEDRIDYKTKKSWRFNSVSETTDPQLIDYNRYGIYPRHRNLLQVYSVKIWNGASWDTLTEGRASDYFINYELGMIYLTRLFLLPAAYGMTGRFFNWGYGEFKNSVQVDYVYGRDSETDQEFQIAKEIAIKFAAKSVIEAHDYSKLITSGTDKISLSEKAKIWGEDIENRIDELCGIQLI